MSETKHLLWLDLEMTGLDSQKDIIVEAGAVVTNFELGIIEKYEARVKQPSSKLKRLYGANDWFQSQPKAYREKMLNSPPTARSLEQIEEDLLTIIARYWSEPVILAGNSIRVDRAFVARYWPRLEQKLHYRMLDVSAWKVFFQGRYGVEYQKKEGHRALSDILESIAELKFYTQRLND